MVANISIYDEISSFIANMNPEKVVAFKPSSANQDRLDSLLDKQKKTVLSMEEKTELEHYLIINRIVGLAKARAIKILRG
jgi:GTP-dependent phosphoenolpyruvate carboxykinase